MIELILEQQTPKATESADPIRDKQLIETCLAYVQSLKDCAGMAANQMMIDGNPVNRRFFLARKDALTPEFIAILNPVITEYRGKQGITIEGCLTWPGRKIYVRRWREIAVYYQDMDGEFRTGTFEDFSAQVYQHETDHLNGVIEHFMDEHQQISVGKQLRNEPCNCGSGKKYKQCCGLVKAN